jgi:exopolysaccharide biosynthesis polyprenyl glycosylphosphotransferase
VRPPLTIKPVTPIRKFASPSRLIPGVQAEAGDVSRKKSSVTVDGRFWDWQGQDGLGEPRKRHLSAIIAEAFFPRLSVHGQRWNLVRQVSADFFLIIFGFAAVGHLILLLEFAIYRDPASLLRPEPFPTAGPGLLLIYGALFTLLGFSERLYHPETVQIPQQEQFVLAKVVFWSAALVVAAVGWSGPHLISLTTLAASAPVNFLLMLAWRRRWRRVPAQSSQGGRDVRNVLIVGAGQVGRQLAACISEDVSCSRSVVGFLDENEPIGGDVHGRLDDLARIARTDFVDEIILTAPHQPDLARRVIREARRNQIDVKVVPDLFGFEPDDPLVFEKFGNIPVLTLREERMPRLGFFLKRVVDTVTAAATLAFAAPLLSIIALVIKLESSGPVLYRAQRVGLKGRRFRCYKFRTMDDGADKLKEHLRASNERQGPFFKMADDPRITRAGRFLRRYSLDELPQLWNVVRGEMSLVGPRPHPLDDFERYDLGDLQRLDVPPGLTGLWQVTARRDPSFERGLALDLEYIRTWTLWRDFQILYKTIAVVLHGSGV